MSNSYDPGKYGELSDGSSNMYTPSETRSRSKKMFLKTDEYQDEYDPNMKESETKAKKGAGIQSMILPKIISLAARLYPAVAVSIEEEMNEIPEIEENRSTHLDLKSNGLDVDEWYNKAAEALTTPDLKLHASKDADVESGLRVPSVVARAALSPSGDFRDWGLSPVSPLAAASLQLPSPSSDMRTPQNQFDRPESPNISVENIAASIEMEYQLRQKEADELLALIQKSHTPSSRTKRISTPGFKTPFDPSSPPPSFPVSQIDESVDYEIEDEEEEDDDDDLNAEILRLNDVAASLRSEMRDLQFESLPTFQVSPDLQHRRRRWQFPSFPRSTSTLSSISFANSEETALQLKTFRTYFGSSGIDYSNQRDENSYISSESMHALYWAIAMVWAVVILLAGHFEFNDFNTWNDVINWLFHL